MLGDSYTAPEMPPYPSSVEEFAVTLAPYQQEKRPAELLLEFLIVEVIGELPERTSRAIDAFAAKTTFFGANGDWRSHIRRSFNLSDTIDIAILDLWYRNGDLAAANGWPFHPWRFAVTFIEQYLADGSRVDVWEGDALAIAKEHIAARRRAN